MRTKLLLMLVAIALVAGTAQANLLVNPGFEDGTFTTGGGDKLTPDFWAHYWTSYNPIHTWVNDSEEAHSGEKYMRMYNWLVYNTLSNSSAYLGQNVPVMKEDGDYTFTVWAKNAEEDQINAAGIWCEWLDSLNQRIGSDVVVFPVNDSDWIKLDFGTITTPEGTAAGTIWLAAPVSNVFAAICYDDITMLGPDPNVDAGPDMITWDGQAVSLTGSELVEGGYTTIEWTTDPNDGAVITDENTLEPEVTILLPSSEMATYKLTLDVDGKYDVTKINVYPDACAAKLAAGRGATDLVGDECITNLADLAEMAATWAVDNALAEPTVKKQEPGTVSGKIAIANAGFEDPVLEDGKRLEPLDWDFVGGNIFAWNPDSGASYYSSYGGIAPEGENVGISGGGGRWMEPENGLGQVLIETLAADLIYELTVEVGNDSVYGWNGYKVQLMAGGTVLAEDDNSLTIEEDTFETSIVTYDSTGADADLVGELLGIRLLVIPKVAYIEVSFDNVRLTCAAATGSRNSSPVSGTYIHPTGELELGWTNMAPFEPNDPEVVYDPNGPVWVDVWFGTDPNKPSPVYDFNKIVDTVENANSVTVDVSNLGTYYWQVNSYIYGDPADVDYNDATDPNSDPDGPPIVEGFVWKFHVATDVPVLVDASDDMITWSDGPVALDAAVVDDGESDVTIAWSADLPTGIASVAFSNPNIEDPTATITKDYSVITIKNHSFEEPKRIDGQQGGLPGWTAPSARAEVWNPGLDTKIYDAYEGIAPDGENVVWVNGIGAISQVLADTLTADSEYTLTVYVGRNWYYPNAKYKVELLAGGRVLAEDDNGIELETDVFEKTEIIFDSNEVDPALLGKPLEIRLWCTIPLWPDGGESNFDDVHLNVFPDRPLSGAVTTVTLTASAQDGAGSDKDTMTIDVYDTACPAAIIGTGREYDPGDLDVDCDTDIVDLAVMAEEWLVYSELTEPVEKP